MMTAITFLVLARKLSLSPLKFLHKDFSRKKQRKAFPLSSRLPFFSRFRIRVILQNMGNYITLFIGILFANFLLFFGLLFPSVLAHYQADIEQNLLCNYQYILQIPLNAVNENKKLESALNMMLFQNEVETETEGAEKVLHPLPEYNLRRFPRGSHYALRCRTGQPLRFAQFR